MGRMRLRSALVACWALLLATLVARAAGAEWLETHVVGDEVKIDIAATGKALVEHRLLIRTNGSVRLRKLSLIGVDRDAAPLSNSYAVPARDAMSNSLSSATPLTLEVLRPDPKPDEPEPPAELAITVADNKGLRRGMYVLVLRYQTDLRARGLIERDGAFVRVSWRGPLFDDGFDNARTTFLVPAAPTPPRPVEQLPTPADEEEGDDETLPPTFLSEVRRGDPQDEVELLRTFAPKGEVVVWAIRVDPRAFAAPLAAPVPDNAAAPPLEAPSQAPLPRELSPLTMGLAAGLFALVLLLVGLRGYEVRKLARASRATVPPFVPLPLWARAPLAAVAAVGGVGMQLWLDRAVTGSVLVVLAAALACHGVARLDAGATMRGPGRWLTVTEREVFSRLPPVRGAYLDISTRPGKAIFLLLGAGQAAAVWWLLPTSLWHAVLVGADGVLLLAIFGTGLARSMPPDMVVEPAKFLRKVLRRLRKRDDLESVRIVPRVRIPTGEMDPDEVRLLLAPRVPLRGFTAIEIGVTYALGLGARVAMPEVLVRVVAGSPCDQALATIARFGRVSPGRKRDERVIRLSPRFPTARMTAEIAAAAALRVVERTPAAPRSREPARDAA
jgi:hypothetical protein